MLLDPKSVSLPILKTYFSNPSPLETQHLSCVSGWFGICYTIPIINCLFRIPNITLLNPPSFFFISLCSCAAVFQPFILYPCYQTFTWRIFDLRLFQIPWTLAHSCLIGFPLLFQTNSEISSYIICPVMFTIGP